MAIKKRKKNSRQRGSHTHGCGSMKKRRGAGNRGGRGRSGSSKRGDQKKPSYWKTERLGKNGFNSHKKVVEMKPINLKTLEDIAPSLEKKGLVKSGTVNLANLGFNKLLGTGNVKNKWSITVDYASPSAVEKVKKAGGEVKVLNVKEEQ